MRPEASEDISSSDITALELSMGVPPVERRHRAHWYETAAGHIGQRMQDWADRNHISEPVAVSSLDDLFTQAKDIVRTPWLTAMMKAYESADLPHRVQFRRRGATPLQSILFDRNAFESVLVNEDIWKLEELQRHGGSDIWKFTVLALSERDAAMNRVLRRWVRRADDELVNRLGLSRKHLLYYIDFMEAIRPHIDGIYVRQIELADAPLGRTLSPYYKVDGSQYMYLLRDQQDGPYTAVPFSRMFPREIRKLTKTMENFAALADAPVLRSYLRDFVKILRSESTDFHERDKSWSALGVKAQKLAKAGIFLIPNPPDFVGDGGVIDFEILTGINRTLTSRWAPASRRFRRIARKTAQNYGLEKEISPMVLQETHEVSGADRMWVAGGFAGEGYILIVENVAIAEANRQYDQFHSLLLRPIRRDQYLRARIINYFAHEYGHKGPMLSEENVARLGYGIHINKLDEAKADHLGSILVRIDLEEGNASYTAEEFIQSNIMGYVDFIAVGYGNTVDTSSTWYAFTGMIIMTRLFESGCIAWTRDGKIDVVNARKGIGVMNRLGRQLRSLYLNEHKTEYDARELVDELSSEIRHSTGAQRFIKKARQLVGFD